MLRRSAPSRDPADDEHAPPDALSAASPAARARDRAPTGAASAAQRAALDVALLARDRPRARSCWSSLAGVALAVLTSWPLVLHMPSRIAPDLGDPVRTAWQIAWVGHAMLHDPLHLFDSNAFYPHPLSLAFSDSLLGYGPAAFFGSGTVAALVRYNLLFLFAWSLCFVGAYLLARELGLRPARRRRRRRGVRLRALPRDRGRAPARDLLRRHRAGAVPAAARLPARLARAGARRLARVGLAGQPRLHARPAVRLPAAGARAGASLSRYWLATRGRAGARAADPPPPARRDADRHRRARRRRPSTRRAPT